MNDLAFGATLLALFAALIAAVIIEITSPVPVAHAAVKAGSRSAPERVARTDIAGCPKLAMAPVAVR